MVWPFGVSDSTLHDGADGERRQQSLALVVAGLGLVDRLDVHLPVAGEADRRAAGREDRDRQGVVVGRVDSRRRRAER